MKRQMEKRLYWMVTLWWGNQWLTERIRQHWHKLIPTTTDSSFYLFIYMLSLSGFRQSPTVSHPVPPNITRTDNTLYVHICIWSHDLFDFTYSKMTKAITSHFRSNSAQSEWFWLLIHRLLLSCSESGGKVWSKSVTFMASSMSFGIKHLWLSRLQVGKYIYINKKIDFAVYSWFSPAGTSLFPDSRSQLMTKRQTWHLLIHKSTWEQF